MALRQKLQYMELLFSIYFAVLRVIVNGKYKDHSISLRFKQVSFPVL